MVWKVCYGEWWMEKPFVELDKKFLRPINKEETWITVQMIKTNNCNYFLLMVLLRCLPFHFPHRFQQSLFNFCIHIGIHSLNELISSALIHFHSFTVQKHIRNSASDNEKTFAPVCGDNEKNWIPNEKGVPMIIIHFILRNRFRKNAKLNQSTIPNSNRLSFQHFIWYRKRWCSDVKWYFFNPFTCLVQPILRIECWWFCVNTFK